MRGQKHRSWNYSMNNFFSQTNKTHVILFLHVDQQSQLHFIFSYLTQYPHMNSHKIKTEQKKAFEQCISSQFCCNLIQFRHVEIQVQNQLKYFDRKFESRQNWSKFFDRKCDRKSTRKQARMTHKTISHTVFETTTTTTTTTLQYYCHNQQLILSLDLGSMLSIHHISTVFQ